MSLSAAAQLGNLLQGSVSVLPIDHIRHRADARPRSDEAVAALSESIERLGLINPIRVRNAVDVDGNVVASGSYEIVAGSHRLQACELLGWRHIPAIIVTADDIAAEMAMIAENLHRADLSKDDRDRQIRRYAELLAQQQAAEIQVRHSVAPEFEDGKAPPAAPEIGYGKPPPQQVGIAKQVAQETGLSVRTIQRVLSDKSTAEKPSPPAAPKQQGGIAARVKERPEPTYERLREAVLFLADLTPADFNRLCPPAKRAGMCQKLSHLQGVFEQVLESASA